MKANWIDVLLLVPLVWYTIKGYKKGLIIELASLLAYVLGFWFAGKFSFLVAGILSNIGELSESNIALISYIVMFIIIIILVNILAKALTKILKVAMLGLVNKLGGALFALLKVLIIISVFLNFYTKIDPEFNFIKEETREDSMLFEPINNISDIIYPRISDKFSELQDMKILDNEKDEDVDSTENLIP